MQLSANYQIGFHGDLDARFDEIVLSIFARFQDAGISRENISILTGDQVISRDRKKPFILVVLCGYSKLEDHEIISSTLNDSCTIIPVVFSIQDASKILPNAIKGINAIAYDSGVDRIVSSILENFRILRKDRRVFISYKRSESQAVAIQLYEKLDSCGFDVFLDTRSVPPGVDFQGVLWHRMADSDVVVLLGTSGFRDSCWTMQELTRASAASIQIVHLLWPGVAADPQSGLSEFVELSKDNFVSNGALGPNSVLCNEVADSVASTVERMRARALAARLRGLVDSFCDRARELGAVTSVQPQRYITVSLPKMPKVLAVVPAVGVPSSLHYDEISKSINLDEKEYQSVWILYDQLGIMGSWVLHLKWLNTHLPLKAVSIVDGVDEMLVG